MEKNAAIRAVEEDKIMSEMVQAWAAAKNKIKHEQRRRAESARIMTKNTGINFNKYAKKEETDYGAVDVVDLTKTKVPELKSGTRPCSAIPAKSNRVYN